MAVEVNINKDFFTKYIYTGLWNAGEKIVQIVANYMGTIKKTGKQYRVPNTKRVYRASASGEPPAVRTGRLRSSIDKRIDRKGKEYILIVGAGAKTKTGKRYGEYLEYGTERIQPRPAFFRIFADKKAMQEIIKSFKEGIQ